MQVSHTENHITHAVIGGKKSMNFGISDDPAFFQILSSALYKYPMLAMVRETICNAWDAHIETGRTDTPLKISLDDDYFIVQDFGPGIPEDLIQPIYGVYGASTKKNDGRQTGGFGLGCKSPFAYTDHFEVTSCHAGTKTIYNMSKSSAEVGGKPSIIPIASFPTEETGITVRIPINPEKRNHELPQLIQRVVFNGDIKVQWNFNGENEVLETIGLDKSECGFVLINDHVRRVGGHLREPRINIRYGNVIYPVERTKEIEALYNKVYKLLDRYYECSLVMQAPPDSISITPSREALTMSDITTGTLTVLLTNFLAVFFKNQELLHRHKEMVSEFVDKASEQEGEFLSKVEIDKWIIHGIPQHTSQALLHTTEEFALLEVLLRYSGRRGSLRPKVWFQYMKQYLFKLQASHNIDRGLLQTWIRETGKNLSQIDAPGTFSRYRYDDIDETRIATSWWQKKIMYPMVKKLADVLPAFSCKNLYYSSPYMEESNSSKQAIEPIRSVLIENHTSNLLHLVQPVLVLTHNAKSTPRRIRMLKGKEQYAESTLRKDVYFVYEIGRKKHELERVLEASANIAGVQVIDLTGRLPEEQEELDERQAKIKAAREAVKAGRPDNVPLVKKARPGLVRLDYILEPQNKRINTAILSESVDPTRITNPEFVARVSTSKDHHHSFYLGNGQFAYATAVLFGTKGAVTNKSDAYDRFKEKGAMDVTVYVADKILHDIQNLPSLKMYAAYSPEKMMDYISDNSTLGWCEAAGVKQFLKLLLDNEPLAFLVPQQVILTEEDKLRLLLWKEVSTTYPNSRRDDIKKAVKEFNEVPLHPEIIEFLDKLIENPFLGLTDIKTTEEKLVEMRKDPTAVAKITAVIQSILN